MNSDSSYWYLASYPKSGNTWCRLFIVKYLEILQECQSSGNIGKKIYDDSKFELNSFTGSGIIASHRYWIDDQLGIDSSDLSHQEVDDVRHLIVDKSPTFITKYRFHKIHDSFNNPNIKEELPFSINGCKGVIYIARRPDDVIVSFSNHFGITIKQSFDFILNERAYLGDADREGLTQVRQYLGTWGDHVDSWLNQKKLPLLLIKYEELLKNPVENFSNIINFLKLKKNHEFIKQASQLCNIENLRKKEIEEGGFIERMNQNQYFFRSGVEGEGKRALSSIQIEILRKRFKKTLTRLRYDI